MAHQSKQYGKKSKVVVRHGQPSPLGKLGRRLVRRKKREAVYIAGLEALQSRPKGELAPVSSGLHRIGQREKIRWRRSKAARSERARRVDAARQKQLAAEE